jgi:lysyl-tRNA synthetase, class I
MQAAEGAVRYFRDFVAPTRGSACPTTRARGDGGSGRAAARPGTAAADAEALQSMVFAVGKEHGFEPLRDWFKALYEVLLGASEGPRFGGFIALYGVEETVALIEWRALDS